MSTVKVGDKVRGTTKKGLPGDWRVVFVAGGVAQLWTGHTFDTVCAAPLSELTLVESAPMTATMGAMLDEAEKSRSYVEEALKQRESLLAENARLREALQMAVDLLARHPPNVPYSTIEPFDTIAAALGIRPKETT